MPEVEQLKVLQSPPRTSLRNDLCFYLEGYPKLLNTSRSDTVSLVCTTIIGAQYNHSLHFSRDLDLLMQCRMTCQNTINYIKVHIVERQWSDLQPLEQRLDEHLMILKEAMIQWCILLENRVLSKDVDWKEALAFGALDADART
jgi:hypothetical protein